MISGYVSNKHGTKVICSRCGNIEVNVKAAIPKIIEIVLKKDGWTRDPAGREEALMCPECSKNKG